MALVVALLALSFLTSGLGGVASAGDFDAIAGASEVAIGLCAAYLGFDRFRFHPRYRKMADKITRNQGAGKDFLIKTRADGRVAPDEADVLSVYELADDDDVKDFLRKHTTISTKKSRFRRSLPGRMLWGLLKLKFDRCLVIAVIVALCVWDVFSSILQLPNARVFDFALPARTLTPVIWATIMGFLLPPLAFLASEVTFVAVRRYMDEALQNIALNMSIYAAEVDPPRPSEVGGDVSS